MKGLNSILNFVIFAACLVLGVGYYYLKTESQKTVVETQPKISVEQMDALVNKHLKKTIQQEQLTQALNQKTMNELKTDLSEGEKLRRFKKDIENAKIPANKQIWKESDFSGQSSEQKFGLDQAEKKLEEMNQEEKQEYARQWIENAKKGGYQLELSPDLQVIKYIPIRKPTQQEDSVETKNTD